MKPAYGSFSILNVGYATPRFKGADDDDDTLLREHLLIHRQFVFFIFFVLLVFALIRSVCFSFNVKVYKFCLKINFFLKIKKFKKIAKQNKNKVCGCFKSSLKLTHL